MDAAQARRLRRALHGAVGSCGESRGLGVAGEGDGEWVKGWENRGRKLYRAAMKTAWRMQSSRQNVRMDRLKFLDS